MLHKGQRVVFNKADALNRDFPTLASIPPTVCCEDPQSRTSGRGTVRHIRLASSRNSCPPSLREQVMSHLA